VGVGKLVVWTSLLVTTGDEVEVFIIYYGKITMGITMGELVVEQQQQ
jgi:hypothetical protein